MSVNSHDERTISAELTVPLEIPKHIATELVGAKIDRYDERTSKGWKTVRTSEQDRRRLERIMRGFELPSLGDEVGESQQTYLVNVTLSELQLLKKFVVSSLRAKRRNLHRLQSDPRTGGVRQSVQQFHRFVQMLNNMLGEQGDGRPISEWREHVVSFIHRLVEELASIVDEEAMVMNHSQADEKFAGRMAYKLKCILEKFSSGLSQLRLD